jgi:murein L,D-transpeptidase YafK
MRSSLNLFLLFAFIFGSAFMPARINFEEIQKRNFKVADAFVRKEQYIKTRCSEIGVPPDDFGNILIRVFKVEAVMEIWVQKPDGKYVKYKDFNVYAMSGKLGPKVEQGDMQVPEGYYYVNDFNPNSNYYLSLGIDYPNQADRLLYPAAHKGGLIYIHGFNVSAGCMAMSNYYVEDIYICAVKARNHGQLKIPVEIFPFKPTAANLVAYNDYIDCKPFDKFWHNLAQGYEFFEKNRIPPDVSIAADGTYKFSDPNGTQQAAK